MSNLIKTSGSTSKSVATKNTNFKIGVNGSGDYGPTNVTGFYNGITPPSGGYTIYVHKNSGGPSIHVANDDTQCIFFLKSFGATGDTINEVLSWSTGRTDMWVQTADLTSSDLDSAPTGYTNTAAIYYDPGNTSSYVGTGTTLTNIGTDGNVSGTTGTLSGVVYESSTAQGVFNFDGGSDKITFNSYNFGNSITTTAWIYPRNEVSINCLMSNCGANTNTNGFKMGWNNWTTTNLTMNFEAGNGSAGGTQSTATNTIVENEWQHIAYVFDKTNQTIKFYRNGSEIATATGGSPVSNIGTNQSWWIGSIGGSAYYMDANMGQFRIYKSLRSTSDISDEYNNTKSRYGL